MEPNPHHRPTPPRSPLSDDERMLKMRQLHEELNKLNAQLEYLSLMLRLGARKAAR